MNLRLANLSDLKPDPNNAREHGEDNLEAIEKSLRNFDQVEPLVVQKGTGMVIGGNGRLAVMTKMGLSECWVVEVEADDQRARALGLALNRTAELADWNQKALADLLATLPQDVRCDVGWTDADYHRMCAQLNDGQTVEDEAPAVRPDPVSRAGELWLMDEHRLLCADSTDLNCVKRVMDGHKAALVQTDPPYLIDYTGSRKLNGQERGKDWSASYHEVEIADADGFFRKLFGNVLEVVAPHAAVYCWHAHPRYVTLATIWQDLGILNHQMIIWVKPAALFGHTFYMFRHEPCLFGWVKGSIPPHDGDHSFNSVWEIDWEGRARVTNNQHPTQKPVEIFARPIRKHTRAGDVCFEPFSGSGSQLIAAEQLKRRCYAIEIEPVFVDVAVRRWQSLTGKDATLDGDGRTFNQIEKERVGGRAVPEEKAPTEVGAGEQEAA